MKMRRGKLIPLKHKGMLLALLSCLVIQSLLISEAEGVRTLRFRSTTAKTTSKPQILITNSNSTLGQNNTTDSKELLTSSNSGSSLETGGKRRRLKRRRKLSSSALGKRQGALYDDGALQQSEEEPQPIYQREALYEGHGQGENEFGQGNSPYRPTPRGRISNDPTPAHYYSPSSRQRERNRKKARIESSSQPFYSSNPTGHPDYNSGGSESDYLGDYPQPQPEPKNYAFAYAVRGDGNSNHNEDFSHKEARDGKLTMGEYRINLPDGRVQVVRYTAGGTIGYKADVTYEGDDPRNKDLAKTVTPNVAPSPGPPYDYNPSGPSGGSSSFSSSSPPSKKYKSSSSLLPTSPIKPRKNKNPYKDYEGQVFLSRPLKSQRSSLSPSQIYHESSPLSATPSPIYKSSGGASSGGSSLRSSSPSSAPFYSYNSVSSTGRPKSIYDKMPQSSSKRPRQNKKPVGDDYDSNLAYLHDQSPRAGPTRSAGSSNSYPYDSSHVKESYYSSSPTKAPLYNEPGPGAYYSSIGPSPTINSGPGPTSPTFYSSKPQNPNAFSNYRSPKPSKSINANSKNYLVESDSGTSTYTPIKTGKNAQLIPIEHFKAGPSRKKYKKNKPNKQNRERSYPNSDSSNFNNLHDDYPGPSYTGPTAGPSYQGPSSSSAPSYKNFGSSHKRPSSYNSNYNSPGPLSTTYKEPFHYYNSQHPPYHHGGYTGPQPSAEPPAGLSQQTSLNQQSTPSLSSYSIDYPGGKHSFYLKTSSGRPENSNLNPNPQKRRKKPNSSGLVYFETPGVGERPTALGVKDILSRIPNMPEPHTTIHPYEIGSKDYGNSVGYKNSHGDAEHNTHAQQGFSTLNHNNNGDHSLEDYQQYDTNSRQHSNNDFDLDHHGSYHPEYLEERPQGDSIVPEGSQSQQAETMTTGSGASTMDNVEQQADMAFQFDDVK